MTSRPSRRASANGSWLTAPQSTVTTSLAPARGEARDRLDVRAVALGDAVGDMDDRLAAAGVEIFAEQRRAAGAVDVVVAEDRDSLAALDGAREPRRRGLHVAQREGVGHQVAQGRVEIARRPSSSATPRPASTRAISSSGRRPGRSPAPAPRPPVEPRPPRPAERGALDIEEIAGHTRSPFPGPLPLAREQGRETLRRRDKVARAPDEACFRPSTRANRLDRHRRRRTPRQRAR